MSTDKRAAATPEKLDAILRTIQNLQGRIEDERLEEGPEKDLMRTHMERLINDYRVTEDELNQINAAEGRAPIAVPGVRRFRAYPYGGEYASVYRSLLGYCASHAQCRVVIGYEYSDIGQLWAVAEVFGYEHDARYAEALFTEARGYFMSRMEPRVNPTLSDGANVYRLRTAGIERGRIGEMMGWGDKAHIRVTNVYKRYCAEQGLEPVMTGKGNSMKTFREAFASAFPNTLWDRLYNARAAAAAEGAVEILGRKEAVDELLYERYPDLRPKPVKVDPTPVKKSRRSGWTKKDEAEWLRLNSGAGALGQRAGAAAAREVNVKGGNATESLEG
jgi:hypothetical protein